MIRQAIVAICVCLAIGVSSYGDTITIDDFDLPRKGTVYMMPHYNGHQWHVDALNTVLGGQRSVFISISDTIDPGSIVASGVIGVDRNQSNNGMFIFGSNSNGQPNTGAVAQLTYKPSPYDLTDHGTNSALALEFSGIDGVVPEGLDVTIMGVSLSQPSPRMVLWSGNIPNSSTALTYYIPFSSFSGDIDAFRSMSEIGFEFNADRTANVDFGLDSIRAVPEPSSFAMACLFLAGCGLCLRFPKFKRTLQECKCHDS